MPRQPRHTPRDSSRRRGWIYLAVVVFLVIDALLIAWALGGSSVDSPHLPSRPIPTFTPSQPSATPIPEAATVAIPSTRLLSALDDTSAWRATTGECPVAPATPELTTDAGNNWQATDATADVQVTALQSLHVVNDALVELVGLSAADCTAQFVRSFVAGNDYSDYPVQLAGQWYVDPANRAVVHTPGGEVMAPCASVVALSVRTDVNGSAAVLCGDTQVFTTQDVAETWGKPVQFPGAVNLTVTTMGYVIATIGLPECAGVQLITLSDTAPSPIPTGCLPVTVPSETLPGNVAVSEAAGTLWVWVGDEVKRSRDEGASWQ